MTKGIKRGQVFSSKDEANLADLPEGHGVVLRGDEKQGFTAYDDSAGIGSEFNKKGLRQNLTGAKNGTGEAVLVVRSNKMLLCGEEAELLIASPKPVAFVPLCKVKRRGAV